MHLKFRLFQKLNLERLCWSCTWTRVLENRWKLIQLDLQRYLITLLFQVFVKSLTFTERFGKAYGSTPIINVTKSRANSSVPRTKCLFRRRTVRYRGRKVRWRERMVRYWGLTKSLIFPEQFGKAYGSALKANSLIPRTYSLQLQRMNQYRSLHLFRHFVRRFSKFLLDRLGLFLCHRFLEIMYFRLHPCLMHFFGCSKLLS